MRQNEIIVPPPYGKWLLTWDYKIPPGGGPFTSSGIIPYLGGDPDPTTIFVVNYVDPAIDPPFEPENYFDGPLTPTTELLALDDDRLSGWFQQDGFLAYVHWWFFSNDTPVIVPRGDTPSGMVRGGDEQDDPLVHALMVLHDTPDDWQYTVQLPSHVNRIKASVQYRAGWDCSPGPLIPGGLPDIGDMPGPPPSTPIDYPGGHHFMAMELGRVLDAEYPYKDPTATVQRGDTGIVRRGRP